MAKFLHGVELHDAIKRIAGEPGARCAVAFWGGGSKAFISDDARIICNLKMGGSNPHELKEIQAKLPPGSVRQSDSLHAKVYLGRDQAVVTSANASANGLGLEGVEQAKWLEAGTLLSDVANVRKWFDALWEDAREISISDWKEAEDAWRARQRRKPSLQTFSDFDLNQSRLPMVLYRRIGAKWTASEDIQEPNITYQRVKDGIWVEHKDELAAMEDRWYLLWDQRSSKPHHPKKNSFLDLIHIGASDKNFIEKSFQWDGDDDYSDQLLPNEDQPPTPFDPNEQNFKKAFFEVITRDDFSSLRHDGESDPEWYRKAEKLLPRFWAAVKERYEAERKS